MNKSELSYIQMSMSIISKSLSKTSSAFQFKCHNIPFCNVFLSANAEAPCLVKQSES